ncbi:MAG: ABC transporter substrate-binding protein [Anaerolineae bacterium]|nr:ABC transporter substrate-binding protein [Anaerolineae bacterium]
MHTRLRQTAWKTPPLIVSGIIALIFLQGLSGCLPPALPRVVKIGLVAPFEGAERDRGYDTIYAARLAIREINAAGGAGGWQLELIAHDDRADPEFAHTAAQNLATDADVVAVIGHFHPDSTAAAQAIYIESELPLLAFDTEGQIYPLPETLPGTSAWIEAYRASGPHTPAPGAYALPTYGAVMTLAEAIAIAATQGEPTRITIATALAQVEQQGFLGTIRWQPGETADTAIIFHPVQDFEALPENSG